MRELQPFGAATHGQPAIGDGDLDDFAEDLQEFFKYGWRGKCWRAAKFIESADKLPALSAREMESHMAFAGAGAIHSILAQVRELQAVARRCLSPAAIAHAERRLSETASKERPAPVGDRPEDFAAALREFGRFSGQRGEGTVEPAVNFIRLTTKLPIAPGGDAEKHLAIAAGTIFQAVLEELEELQEAARRCFSPEDVAQAELGLAEIPYDGGTPRPRKEARKE